MSALVSEPDLTVVTPSTPSLTTTSVDEPIHEVILEEDEEEEGEEEEERQGEEKVVEQFVCDVEEEVDLQEAWEEETVYSVTETSIQSLENQGTLRALLS